MGGHAVRDRLDRGLGVDGDDACLDQVGDMGADHHDPEQLAVPALVDRLDPAGRLVLHHGAGVGDPWEYAGLDVVAVLLPGLLLRQAYGGDLGIGVDGAGHGAVVDHGLVAQRVLRGDLSLAEGSVRELPVAGAVADSVDVVDGGAAVLVGRDPLSRVQLDPELLEAEVLDLGRTPDGDEHQVGFHRLALAEVDGERGARVLDLRALLLEVEGDRALAELLRELLGGVRVLLRDQAREHLDDRDLGAEPGEDRRELAADDPAAQDDEALRKLLLREETRRVDAAGRVEPLDRRMHREAAGRDDGGAEGDVLPTLDRDRVRVGEAACALHPLDPIRLEELRNAAGHLLDDAVLPLVRGREVELWLADVDSELGEGLVGLLDREGGLHPGLCGDAADPEAGAAELGLLLDADGLGAELRGADRGRVAARAASQNGNVTFHRFLLLGRFRGRSYWRRRGRRPRRLGVQPGRLAFAPPGKSCPCRSGAWPSVPDPAHICHTFVAISMPPRARSEGQSLAMRAGAPGRRERSRAGRPSRTADRAASSRS